jgi:hypothetical protein
MRLYEVSRPDICEASCLPAICNFKRANCVADDEANLGRASVDYLGLLKRATKTGDQINRGSFQKERKYHIESICEMKKETHLDRFCVRPSTGTIGSLGISLTFSRASRMRRVNGRNHRALFNYVRAYRVRDKRGDQYAIKKV